MLSVADAGDCDTSGRKKDDTNPFERLQPPLRSEEDEIRKGIFGQALRLLHVATDEEKLRWRQAIMDAAAARQSGQRGAKKKKKTEAGENDNAAVKRTRDGTDMKEEDKEIEKKREEGAQEEEKVEGPETKTCVRSENDTIVANNDGPSHDAAATDEPISDTEFIAAYLRTLLDKVVGLSLLELHVEALRVLCVMLGIPLPNNRNKIAHYSTLASFHYTHCEKLGKRVSSSHNLQAQLKRDEEMIRRIFSHGPTSPATPAPGKNKTAVTGAPVRPSGTTAAAATTTTTSGKSSDKNNSRQTNGTRLVAIDSNVSSLAGDSRERRHKSSAHGLSRPPNTSFVETDNNTPDGGQELEIRHHNGVFVNAAAAREPPPTHDEEEEWSMAQLEKKVASVVQLYDPVTSAIVVKKLAKMGYRAPCATETVEAILRSFHQRELVFYDNGIAYLL